MGKQLFKDMSCADLFFMKAMEESLKELRETFRSGITRCSKWRKTQLRALLALLNEHEQEIFAALNQDLGKHPTEAYKDEIGVLVKSVNHALSCLDKWMANESVWVPLLVFPSSAQVVREPLGLVLVFSTWNLPLGLTLEPAIGAIAAGNVVALKPSELAPVTSSLIAKLVPKYLDSNAVKVFEGGVAVSEQLLEKKWDKIFFTGDDGNGIQALGQALIRPRAWLLVSAPCCLELKTLEVPRHITSGSTRVARVIMEAAAKHLTPITLELGGKCPAIMDSNMSARDIEVSIKRLVSGKWGVCNGQACIAVDYVLVEDHFASTLIDLLRAIIKRFFGDNPKESSYTSRIINKQQIMRLKNLLKDSRVEASVVHGGAMHEEDCYIEPTILLDPPLDSDIMTDEIFGPLLPIITLKKIKDSIEFINSRPKPLAIYVFTKDETLKKRVVSETSSGSVIFNDAVIQYALDTIPFGGVGKSGFGKYHGKYSFETFSHEKAVVRRSHLIEFNFRYPPWTSEKLELIRTAYKFDYLKLFYLLLGFKRWW